jgi:signal transduction histidine kinase
MKKKRTIEFKILIPFLIVVLLPCIAIGASAYWTGFQSYKQERFDETINQLQFLTTYTLSMKEQDAIDVSLQKTIAKEMIAQTDSVYLFENNTAEPTGILKDGETPWWKPYIHEVNGKYQREDTHFLDFQEEWVLIQQLTEWDWTIAIPFSFSYFAEPLIEIQKNTLLVMIVAAVIAVELTIILSHHLSRPLKSLAAYCQNQGQVDKMEEEPFLSRNDEIGILADSIRQMLANIEEKKQLEKRMERIGRLASMGQMASGIAHEIRNPLAGIKTTTQVLSSRLELDDRNQPLFDGITEEIDRVNRIITNLLNLSRPRDPHPKWVNIEEVISKTIFLLEKESKNKNIQFFNHVKRDQEYYVDPDHFKQILINLSLNAVNAMDEGGRIRFFCDPNGRLFVRDEGKGITKEDLDKIFNPFFTTSASGTGLGLTMVHQLVLQNNGEIEINSKVNKGTSFILEFPVKREEENDG